MIRLRIGLLSVACTTLLQLTLSSTYAQSAQDIVAKHIEALGGKERLQSINSVFIEGVAKMDNGTEIDTKLWKVYDRVYRQEVSVGAGSVVTIVTPSRGWVCTKGSYKSLPSNQLRALQPQIDPAGALADYAAKGCKVSLDGRDTVEGKPCYRVRLTCPYGQSVTYSIDVDTYYILRETRKSNIMNGSASGAVATEENTPAVSGDFMTDFSDYKKTPDGYIFPYTIVSSGVGAKINVERVEVNRNVNVDGLSRPVK